MKIPGTIRKFITRGFYAFADRDDGQHSVFIHGSVLRDLGLDTSDTGPIVGARISFEIAKRPDGKLYAVDVQKAEDPNLGGVFKALKLKT